MSTRARKNKIKPMTVYVDFLKSCTIRHVWPFSAFAELLDNSYDPDASAKKMIIDVVDISDTRCIKMTDNGYGMDSDHLYHMLCLGHTVKQEQYRGDLFRPPIGQYGWGFKTGSMRLADDALIFTVNKNSESASVGFLSRTYIQKNMDDGVIRLPMITFSTNTRPYQPTRCDGWKENLDEIIHNTIFKSEEELTSELIAIEDEHQSGTCIVLFNLKKNGTDEFELDFNTDPSDIRCDSNFEDNEPETESNSNSSNTYKTSLKHYLAILYRKPKMRIFLCGSEVKVRDIEKDLILKPKPKERRRAKAIEVIAGVSQDETLGYGLMLYYQRRLIEPFKKIGCQKKDPPEACRVIAIMDNDQITPSMNKQAFVNNDTYKKALRKCRDYINNYWKSLTVDEKMMVSKTTREKVKCAECGKIRYLLKGEKADSFQPFYCRFNPDERYNHCAEREESAVENDDPSDDDSTQLDTSGRQKPSRRSGRKRRAGGSESPIPGPSSRKGSNKRQSSQSLITSYLQKPHKEQEDSTSAQSSSMQDDRQTPVNPTSDNSSDAGNSMLSPERSIEPNDDDQSSTLPLSNNTRGEPKASSFKEKVLQLLHILQPDFEFDDFDDVEEVVEHMIESYTATPE